MALLEAGRRRFARAKGAAALCRERKVSRRGRDRPCTGEGSKTPSPLPEQAPGQKERRPCTGEGSKIMFRSRFFLPDNFKNNEMTTLKTSRVFQTRMAMANTVDNFNNNEMIHYMKIQNTCSKYCLNKVHDRSGAHTYVSHRLPTMSG